MARKFEPRPGDFAWNLERCEEVVMVADYEEIAKFIEPATRWKPLFEMYFYDAGKAVLQKAIDEINGVRRRRGLPCIEFRETDIGDYARTRDDGAKAEQRRRLRDELSSVSSSARSKIVDTARSEIERLPPPHRTYEEYKTDRQYRNFENAQSLEEAKRRAAVLNGITPAPPTKPAPADLDPSIAAKMLRLATDPALREIILARLAPAAALAAAEGMEDLDLRDVLIRRALDGVAP